MTNALPVPARIQGYHTLRINSVCGVVAIHTFGPSTADIELRGSAYWWIALVMSAGAIWTVPVFVMLSGALSLTTRAHAHGAAGFYAQRARRIIPAIVAWNLVYLVGMRMFVLHQQLSLHSIVQLLLNATVYPHLYFLWLISGGCIWWRPSSGLFSTRRGHRGPQSLQGQHWVSHFLCSWRRACSGSSAYLSRSNWERLRCGSPTSGCSLPATH